MDDLTCLAREAVAGGTLTVSGADATRFAPGNGLPRHVRVVAPFDVLPHFGRVVD